MGQDRGTSFPLPGDSRCTLIISCIPVPAATASRSLVSIPLSFPICKLWQPELTHMGCLEDTMGWQHVLVPLVAHAPSKQGVVAAVGPVLQSPENKTGALVEETATKSCPRGKTLPWPRSSSEMPTLVPRRGPAAWAQRWQESSWRPAECITCPRGPTDA